MEGVKNAKDITLDNFLLRCIIYGKPKMGKTLWAASAPSPFIATFDDGMLSVRELDCPYKVYRDTRTFITDLNEIVEKKTVPFEGKDVPVKTFVLDSMTTLQDFCINELIVLNARQGSGTGQIADFVGKGFGASQHEYGVRIMWLSNLLLTLKSTPFNLIIIAHEETITDKATGSVITRPMIAGEKLPNKVPIYVDEIYQVIMGRGKTAETPTYNLITKGDEAKVAGSRLGVLPRVIDITFDKKENNRGFDTVMDFVRKEGK